MTNASTIRIKRFAPYKGRTNAVPQNASRTHVVFALLLIEFSLLLRSGILVLLVLGNEIVHVGFCLSEFHLIHTLTRVPMKESLAPEHGSEILGNALEHFLNRRRISSESN